MTIANECNTAKYKSNRILLLLLFIDYINQKLLAVTVRMDSSDFRISLSSKEYSSFKKDYKSCQRVMLGILADTRWCYAKSFPATFHDSKIIDLIYPELQPHFDEEEIIMVDKLFDTKYKTATPRIINGYKRKNGIPLKPYQIMTNKEIEAHRGIIEKCIGHFKNKFNRFDGDVPFAYDHLLFEPMFRVALALDNLAFSDLSNWNSIASNHPFFSPEFIPEWDDPFFVNQELSEGEEDEEFNEILNNSRMGIEARYPQIYGKSNTDEDEYVPMEPHQIEEDEYIPVAPSQMDDDEQEELIKRHKTNSAQNEDEVILKADEIEEEIPILSEASILKLKVKELKEELEKRKERNIGLKGKLCKRLLDHENKRKKMKEEEEKERRKLPKFQVVIPNEHLEEKEFEFSNMEVNLVNMEENENEELEDEFIAQLKESEENQQKII